MSTAYMTKIKELYQARGVNHKAMVDIAAGPRTESRDFIAEEQEAWDKADAEEIRLHAEIQALEARQTSQDDRETRIAAIGDGLTGQTWDPRKMSREDQSRRISSNTDAEVRGAMNTWLRSGGIALNQEQRALIGYQPAGSVSGIPAGGDMIHLDLRSILAPEEYRDMSTGTDSLGGSTIPTETLAILVEALQAFGGMRRARTTKLNTNAGHSIVIPNMDETDKTGVLLAEAGAVGSQDAETGSITLDSFMYTSEIIKTSIQLLEDSPTIQQNLLFRIAGTRVARITNTHFTTGDGSGKPLGIMAIATTGATAASATALTMSEMLELKHSVDEAYRDRGAEWMFRDATLKAIKQLSIGSSDARSLWMPGFVTGEPDTIDGDPYIINADVAAIAASAKSVAYGDFSAYWIRTVTGMTLLRFNELFMGNLQVGFLAFGRFDGDLIDRGGAVKVLIHPTA